MQLPAAAKQALSRYVSQAVNRLDPARYKQEPAYVAALFGRLDGVVYRSREVTIEIRSTVVNDRGRGSAESVHGADFGIVASIASNDEVVEKAVLGQAKKGSLAGLPSVPKESFREQVVKMSALTRATIGFEVPTAAGAPPMIRIVEAAQPFHNAWSRTSLRKYEEKISATNVSEPPVYLGTALPLGRYLYAELLRCLHGDNDIRLLHALTASSLPVLHVNARTTTSPV